MMHPRLTTTTMRVQILLLLLFVGEGTMWMRLTAARGVLETLTDLSYDVVFSKRPLLQSSDRDRHYPMRLSNGSAYICVLPPPQQVHRNGTSSFEVNRLVPAHVALALHDSLRGWCLSLSESWWTYRLCWNSKVVQFHLPRVILQKGDVAVIEKTSSLWHYVLGVAPGEDLVELRYGVDPSGERYIYTTYRNGDLCDVTQLPRSTEVRVYCARDDDERSLTVREMGVCQYVTSMVSKRVCVAELQRPVKHDVIVCHEMSSQRTHESSVWT